MYKLSNLAAEDFAFIYEYTLLNFGVLQADNYTDSLESTFDLLSNSPNKTRFLRCYATGEYITL